MAYVDGRQTLSFDVALDRPYMIRDRLEVAINDPEYYVAITLTDVGSVQLVNAPANCAVVLEDSRPMSDDLAQQLADLGPDVTQLPPDLEQKLRGVQGAIAINCPGSSATGEPVGPLPEPSAAMTPQAVANQASESSAGGSSSRPMGGPPPEPGLEMSRTGILGWIAQAQSDFYQALVQSLDALRTEWTAFWVLGGLSFLYGVFHAAGPGHGKVVFSSYVLANETQVRRGIGLSFLSAMLQSLVAIGLVLVAALLLGLTSMAMNDTAHWIGVASYVLMVVLGLWLVARKLAGTRRHHEHDGHHRQDHDDHAHHAHVVTPAAIGSGWREQLGIVLAVGLRPCSGALIVLAFALSQGLLAAGITSVLLMGLGTAATTGMLAALAVSAKGLALRLAGTDSPVTRRVVWWAEMLGALAVLAFGLLLLLSSL